MYRIFIDNTKRDDKKIELYKNLELIEKVTGDFDLISSLKKLLNRHNIRVENLDAVDINKGPGSFTGLKTSATIANIFNWLVKNKKLSEMIIPEYGKEPQITGSKKL